VIHSFRGRATKLVWEGRYSPSLPTGVQATALRKLRLLNEAGGIAELAAIPGNRLERLRGDRHGQYSIRVNDQWRICFLWTNLGAASVEIVDYHS
jgi:toxin HigB-1